MATWKENGVVPDSEDEDVFDNESIASYDGQNYSRGEDHTHGHPNEVAENQPRDRNPEDILLSNHDEAAFLSSQNVSSQHLPTLRTVHGGRFESHATGENAFPISSPGSPRVFKIPELFWDNGDLDDGQKSPLSRMGNPPSADDICKSYVRITSPASSPLSSAPSSPMSLPLPPPSIISARRETTISRAQPENLTGDDGPINDSTIYSRRRSLRQRNPIQLHPYIVEQEKYRQTLKSRGIAPMRLASSQSEEHRKFRKSASPDPESQDTEFQIGSSPDMELAFDSLASLHALNVNVDDTDPENEQALPQDDDDEFPDVSQLFQIGRPKPTLVKSEQKIKPSIKYKRPLPSNIEIHRPEVNLHANMLNDIFDVPASPPTTSSPFRATSRRYKPAMFLRVSSSPEDSTGPSISRDEPVIQRVVDLPTPATSASKPIPLLLESDLDDPFESDRDELVSTSSSDESVQIREIGKRIKGVLPASHLRLDNRQRTTSASSHPYRDFLSASPAKTVARRGVALPKVRKDNETPSTSGIPFLSDNTEDDDISDDENGFAAEHNAHVELESLFIESRMGLAEEDDKIDAMLPSRKRQRAASNHSSKKRRIGSHVRQPKITEHMQRPKKSTALSSEVSRQKRQHAARPWRSSTPGPRRSVASPAPRLSILDVLDPLESNEVKLPDFIKIAARIARSKREWGRHSPSRKFIRLANREDTEDVQSVLQDWKDGKIQPKDPAGLFNQPFGPGSGPLKQIENNRQSRLRNPMAKVRRSPQRLLVKRAGLSQKMVISRPKQRSMNDFITNGQGRYPVLTGNPERGLDMRPSGKSRAQARIIHPAARPAQLESSEAESLYHHSTSKGFGTSKKALDAVYRNARRRSAPQANLQLRRFLADGNLIQPLLDSTTAGNIGIKPVLNPPNQDSPLVSKPPLRKKKAPQRLDTGAAMYRQPSDPLILEFLAVDKELDAPSQSARLLGLGKFGTSYPLHFEIFPLHPGVFFHESTFIGSGRLADVVKEPGSESSRTIRPRIPMKLGAKLFSWESWNENVSSEIGVCFDWILEQLASHDEVLPNSHNIEVAGVMTFVVDYVQHQVKWRKLAELDNFLSRMAEILMEVLSRVNVTTGIVEPVLTKRLIEFLSLSTLLLLQLLQKARSQQTLTPIARELEDLLKMYASRCITLLLSDGLIGIRKLYDDLQYLFQREKGIKGDQYAIEAWVIILKVLESAHIPKGSFWDIANSRLIQAEMRNSTDARMMEKAWYSMFSLLPLCEFDEFGVVITGLRQTPSFDNWYLPQLMLKNVFTLYGLNQRQSPGFNDYCRSIVKRCHYLMTEWGWWKCSGVIGTLFDFFASQNLSHLRNEEAYASAHFLEELDKDPTLALEAEDCCFHIFLKIVALAIKNLRVREDSKGIRNLVARLLPNHNRQYPKEESIRQRDLASLRNHHDLLSTLFWAATPEQRPSLLLIQDLVAVDRSHNEACLINLRAWENIARFVVTHSTDIAAYQPLLSWQTGFFDKIRRQYLGMEAETRQQAEALHQAGQASLSENRIREVIQANQESTMVLICLAVKAMSARVLDATSGEMAMAAFNSHMLWNALTPDLHASSKMSYQLIDDCMCALSIYLDKIESFHPRTLPVGVADTNEELDSQASLESGINWGRLEMIYVLHFNSNSAFCDLLKMQLETNLDKVNPSHGKVLSRMICCWAHLVSLSLEAGETTNLSKFLVDGPNSVFQNRHMYNVAEKYWPLFMSKLLEYKCTGKLMTDRLIDEGFNIGLEWLLVLIKPDRYPLLDDGFTKQLLIHEYELCSGVTSETSPIRQIQTAVQNMSEILLKEPKRRGLYTHMLEDMMKSMQRHLESLDPSSKDFDCYLNFVQIIIPDIKSSNIGSLNDFFIRSSRHYWPKDSDPDLYTAGVLSYSRRLNQPDQERKASFELFHYLLGGWKKALVSQKMSSHLSHIKKAMKKDWKFTEFLLTNFVPAIIQIGFRYNPGWIISFAYLPILADMIGKLLQHDNVLAADAFRHSVNILKLVVNELLSCEQIPSPFEMDDRGIRPLACQFFLEMSASVHICAVRNARGNSVSNLDLLTTSNEIKYLFEAYLRRNNQFQIGYVSFNGQDQPRERDVNINKFPDVPEGKYSAQFVVAMAEEIETQWEFQQDGTDPAWVRIRVGRSSTRVDLDLPRATCPTLSDILQHDTKRADDPSILVHQNRFISRLIL